MAVSLNPGTTQNSVKLSVDVGGGAWHVVVFRSTTQSGIPPIPFGVAETTYTDDHDGELTIANIPGSGNYIWARATSRDPGQPVDSATFPI